MKIIGKSSDGYICEVSKKDMTTMTGKAERPYETNHHQHGIGATINVPDFAQHIENMAGTGQQRKQAAELLRSAANIIETVPDAFTAPKPQPPVNRAAEELREAIS